jgi:hypothetical protein
VGNTFQTALAASLIAARVTTPAYPLALAAGIAVAVGIVLTKSQVSSHRTRRCPQPPLSGTLVTVRRCEVR